MPLTLCLRHPALSQALRLRIHAWQPDGLAYPGLPKARAEAAARREERLTREIVDTAELTAPADPPLEAVGDYSVDLRWLTAGT